MLSGARRALAVAAAIGAVWGLAGYAVLWGHTSIVVSRSFVVSPIGTILLLPVRTVLWTIHSLERAAREPFEFSDNNWWIGLASAMAGAVIAWGLGAVILLVARTSGRKGVAETPERL